MKDFFVSYNSADRQWAEWVAWHLEEAGYTAIVQAWDFAAGSNFVLEMHKAAQEAERTVAVSSPDYLKALYTQPEWAAAFVHDPTGKQRKLLPVRVRECELKGLLAPIVYVDLVGLDEDAAKQALLERVSRERAKPAVAPGFPGAAPRSVAERPRFPGALPPVWNVPHRRNRNFTGREALLRDLRDALTSGRPAAVTQAISGLGGVGKTQLAVEYAYRHASEYEVVWWVRSEEPATLGSDYAALATALDLDERGATDQRVVVEAVRRWLEQNTGWLLVFDNAPGANEVRDYLPRSAIGHVLVTSRSQAWGSVATPLSVAVMERAESVELLLKRTGETDEAAAEALADELGDLPLALEQAAAYVEQTGRSLLGYLELFRERRQEVLARVEPPADYPATVATTWELAFQEVEEASPVAADLLRLMAFLAPDDMPLSLLSEGEEHLPEPLKSVVADPLVGDDALAVLRRYSLVEVAEKSLSVHRLVQAVMRDRLSEEERKRWVEAAVRLADAAFPLDRDDPATWVGSSRLLPHAVAAAGHGEAFGVALETVAGLLNDVGGYLRLRANFGGAEAAQRRALAIGEAAHGADGPEVATYANNLGLVLRDQGDLEGARAHYERALAYHEAAYGPDHPAVAAGVNNLGRVLREQGDLEGARAHYERALAIVQDTRDPNHPEVAICANNLGRVLRDQGDLEGARAHFERALAIDEGVYGPDHPTVAVLINNLGDVLRAQGDLGGARAHFERALRIFQEFLGDEHPNTVTVRDNLRALDAQSSQRR